MKMLRKFMRSVGAWTSRSFGVEETRLERVYRGVVVAVESACLPLGLLYLRQNVGKLTFFEIGHSYITVMLNMVAVARAILLFTDKYSVILGDFVNRIHLFHWRGMSDYAMQTHIMIHKISHFLTVYSIMLMLVGVTLFNATPLYANYAAGAFGRSYGNVTLQHSVYYALPFDYTTDYTGYSYVFCFNWYISVTCINYVLVFDLIMSLMVFHTWGHLKILIHNIETFTETLDDPNGDADNGILYSVERNKEVYEKLRYIIRYHQFIIQFMSKMSETFGYVLFIYYGFHLCSDCLLLLECSQMSPEALLRYLPLCLGLYQQLIQLSIIFELIGAMTDKLADAAYGLPWERMDRSNRRTCHILLRQAQASLNLKALDMVDVGVGTMTAILKTSFSYFVMLRTVALKSE